MRAMAEEARTTDARGKREPLSVRIASRMSRDPAKFHWWEVPVGAAAALLAVGIRYPLPILPTQLPTLTVVVAIMLMGTFVGLAAGITAAIVGGLLSCYLFFTPFSFDMGEAGMIPLLGFAVIAAALLTTSQFYRTMAYRNYHASMEAARKDAETAELFARELAHRLKNALAVVQSIAMQTLPNDQGQLTAFSARLRAMASAHDLLTEHVDRPTAKVRDVVDSSLQPFLQDRRRLDLSCPDLTLGGQDVVSLSLVLHELATNACKYGAWSHDHGNVALTIAQVGSAIGIAWHEGDGPPVTTSGRGGFGTKLLKRVGSNPVLDLRPEGLRYSTTLQHA
jgi:two-component sensor histidine kinase